MEWLAIDVKMIQIKASRNVDTEHPLGVTFWRSEASMSLIIGLGIRRSVLETCVSTDMEEDLLSRISYVFPTHLQRTRSSIIHLKKSFDTILLRISREVPWDLSEPERWRDISSCVQRVIELTRAGTHVWYTRPVQRTRMKSARRGRRWSKTLFRVAPRQEEFRKCDLREWKDNLSKSLLWDVWILQTEIVFAQVRCVDFHAGKDTGQESVLVIDDTDRWSWDITKAILHEFLKRILKIELRDENIMIFADVKFLNVSFFVCILQDLLWCVVCNLKWSDQESSNETILSLMENEDEMICATDIL